MVEKKTIFVMAHTDGTPGRVIGEYNIHYNDEKEELGVWMIAGGWGRRGEWVFGVGWGAGGGRVGGNQGRDITTVPSVTMMCTYNEIKREFVR